VSGFYAPNSVQFSKIALHVNTGDGSTADWGIYDSSGNLKANVGGHAVGAGGFDDRSTAQGSVTLAAGKYYFAFTANGVGVTLLSAAGAGTTHTMTFAVTQELAASSSGGALPSTISVPADSWGDGSAQHAFSLHT